MSRVKADRRVELVLDLALLPAVPVSLQHLRRRERTVSQGQMDGGVCRAVGRAFRHKAGSVHENQV